MPIPRRISQSDLEAPSWQESSPNQQSGVYRAAQGTNLDELEEVHDDDDEFDFPDIPSLMPGVHADSLMDVATAPAPRPIPVFELELPVNPVPHRPQPLIRTSSTANMAAVRPPTPAAAPVAPPRAPEVGLFDSFEEEQAPLDLSLDIKAPPSARGVIANMAGVEMSPAPESAPTPISSTQKTSDPRPGIVAFAGFGLPPETLGGTPAYALRVIARKWTLRDDLRIARLRRIQDVTLYEAALACADEGAVTKGLALIATSVIGTIGAIVTAAAFLL